jgi:hypothetical protein
MWDKWCDKYKNLYFRIMNDSTLEFKKENASHVIFYKEY